MIPTYLTVPSEKEATRDVLYLGNVIQALSKTLHDCGLKQEKEVTENVDFSTIISK